MYESITYAEIKSLPKEQKPDAWKELKAMYSSQKELAEKLSVNPSIVYNMISRYAKEEKTETVKTLKKANRMKKQEIQEKQEQNVDIIEAKPAVQETITAKTNEVVNETFSIFIKKAVSGEDAQLLLNGIGSTLLKNKKYEIEVMITEK